MDDRKSWEVKGEAIYEDLVKLIGLSDEERSAIAGMKADAEKVASEMVDNFYKRLLAYENTAEFFHGQDIELRKKTIHSWFMDLFAGKYDGEYTRQRLKIGQVHVLIGLPVRYPLAMLDIVMEYGLKATAGNETAQRAFRKLIALDIAVFNQAYENSQLKHLAETVGNERLARRLLTQKSQE